MREFNLALEGNEPEIKALLKNSETFIGVLDDNKQAILAALEKIDRLSVATLNQRKSITQALDDIPPALKILDKQRDDLVAMLKAFERLSNVATSVIRRSKKDTITDLRRLKPLLRELANAGDSIANAFTLLTYPFPDSLVGGVGRVMSSCSTPSNLDEVRDGACFGDYINLDINLEMNAEQVAQLVAGLLSSGPELPSGSAAGPSTNAEGQKLPELLNGLVPEGPQSQSSESTERAPAVTCSLLGLCRVPASSLADAQQSDVGRLLLGPAVAS